MPNIKLAAALKYEEEKGKTPVVLASGRGLIAERLMERAAKEDIPLYKGEILAELLTNIEVGTEIPPELYEAVAQVIAFIWQLDNKGKGFD